MHPCYAERSFFVWGFVPYTQSTTAQHVDCFMNLISSLQIILGSVHLCVCMSVRGITIHSRNVCGGGMCEAGWYRYVYLEDAPYSR